MKKLMTLALIALLSFGVASVSWAADEGAAGGQPASGDMKAGKTEKKHKGKKKKKSKKSQEAAPAAGETK